MPTFCNTWRDAEFSRALSTVALVDLLDRVLATGVVVTGDISISVADVDLIRISLRALLSSVGTLAPATRPGGR
jgi:hypothetical protein